MSGFKSYALAALASTLLVLPGCSSYPDHDIKNTVAEDGTKQIAKDYVEYAMLASNAYHSDKKMYFPVDLLGWKQVDADGNEIKEGATADHWFTGLSYDIYENEKSGEIVFAIRGSDGKWDYAISNFSTFGFSYRQANNAAREYMRKNPGKKVVAVGHSLGGGIAFSISAKTDHPPVEAVVFNPSPRVFDGIGDKHADAKRVMVFEKGEILETIRSEWPKIFELTQAGNIFAFHYDFGKSNKHKSDCLAYWMLKDSVEIDPSLSVVLSSVKMPAHEKNVCAK